MTAEEQDNVAIVAISNPRSGRNKRGGFEKFKAVLQAFPEIKHIVTKNENDLLEALALCQSQQIKILMINGGDGTLLQILTYLKNKENCTYVPCLVLLKAGTTSMAYGDVGCKVRIEKVIRKTIQFAQGEGDVLKKTQRNVLQMVLPDSHTTVCGMFFGAGAIYNGILYCRQNIHTKAVRGELGPTMAMMRYILDWLTVNKMITSTQAKIDIDETISLQGDYSIITATTLNRLLMGVYPFWSAKKSANHIALTLIKKHAPKAASAFINILRGNEPGVEYKPDFYQSFCSENVSLVIQDGFTLDGELFGRPGVATQVELSSAGSVTFLTE